MVNHCNKVGVFSNVNSRIESTLHSTRDIGNAFDRHLKSISQIVKFMNDIYHHRKYDKDRPDNKGGKLPKVKKIYI